ncbi:EF-hand domain-containing protein 1 [Sparganum proliferum]
MAGHFVAGFAMVLTIIAFTFGSLDSRWVPYPRFNKLSWAYAMALISVMFTTSAFFTFLVFYLKVNAKKSAKSLPLEPDLDDADDDDENDEIQKLSQKQYSRSGDTASGPLRPPVNPDNVDPDEIHEDLGEDLDANSNSVYPYSQHFRS